MGRRKCDIEDIQRSPDAPELHAKVDAFMNAERFESSAAWAPMQKKILEESGLYDESPETIIEMQEVVSDYRRFRAKHDQENPQ